MFLLILWLCWAHICLGQTYDQDPLGNILPTLNEQNTTVFSAKIISSSSGTSYQYYFRFEPTLTSSKHIQFQFTAPSTLYGTVYAKAVCDFSVCSPEQAWPYTPSGLQEFDVGQSIPTVSSSPLYFHITEYASRSHCGCQEANRTDPNYREVWYLTFFSQTYRPLLSVTPSTIPLCGGHGNVTSSSSTNPCSCTSDASGFFTGSGCSVVYTVYKAFTPCCSSFFRNLPLPALASPPVSVSSPNLKTQLFYLNVSAIDVSTRARGLNYRFQVKNLMGSCNVGSYTYIPTIYISTDCYSSVSAACADYSTNNYATYSRSATLDYSVGTGRSSAAFCGCRSDYNLDSSPYYGEKYIYLRVDYDSAPYTCSYDLETSITAYCVHGVIQWASPYSASRSCICDEGWSGDTCSTPRVALNWGQAVKVLFPSSLDISSGSVASNYDPISNIITAANQEVHLLLPGNTSHGSVPSSYRVITRWTPLSSGLLSTTCQGRFAAQRNCKYSSPCLINSVFPWRTFTNNSFPFNFQFTDSAINDESRQTHFRCSNPCMTSLPESDKTIIYYLKQQAVASGGPMWEMESCSFEFRVDVEDCEVVRANGGCAQTQQGDACCADYVKNITLPLLAVSDGDKPAYTQIIKAENGAALATTEFVSHNTLTILPPLTELQYFHFDVTPFTSLQPQGLSYTFKVIPSTECSAEFASTSVLFSVLVDCQGNMTNTCLAGALTPMQSTYSNLVKYTQISSSATSFYYGPPSFTFQRFHSRYGYYASGCGCANTRSGETNLLLSLQFSRSDSQTTCNYTLHARAEAYCFNGGIYNSVQDTCTCPQGWSGSRCNIAILSLNRTESNSVLAVITTSFSLLETTWLPTELNSTSRLRFKLEPTNDLLPTPACSTQLEYSLFSDCISTNDYFCSDTADPTTWTSYPKVYWPISLAGSDVWSYPTTLTEKTETALYLLPSITLSGYNSLDNALLQRASSWTCSLTQQYCSSALLKHRLYKLFVRSRNESCAMKISTVLESCDVASCLQNELNDACCARFYPRLKVPFDDTMTVSYPNAVTTFTEQLEAHEVVIRASQTTYISNYQYFTLNVTDYASDPSILNDPRGLSYLVTTSSPAYTDIYGNQDPRRLDGFPYCTVSTLSAIFDCNDEPSTACVAHFQTYYSNNDEYSRILATGPNPFQGRGQFMLLTSASQRTSSFINCNCSSGDFVTKPVRYIHVKSQLSNEPSSPRPCLTTLKAKASFFCKNGGNFISNPDPTKLKCNCTNSYTGVDCSIYNQTAIPGVSYNLDIFSGSAAQFNYLYPSLLDEASFTTGNLDLYLNPNKIMRFDVGPATHSLFPTCARVRLLWTRNCYFKPTYSSYPNQYCVFDAKALTSSPNSAAGYSSVANLDLEKVWEGIPPFSKTFEATMRSYQSSPRVYALPRGMVDCVGCSTHDPALYPFSSTNSTIRWELHVVNLGLTPCSLSVRASLESCANVDCSTPDFSNACCRYKTFTLPVNDARSTIDSPITSFPRYRFTVSPMNPTALKRERQQFYFRTDYLPDAVSFYPSAPKYYLGVKFSNASCFIPPYYQPNTVVYAEKAARVTLEGDCVNAASLSSTDSSVCFTTRNIKEDSYTSIKSHEIFPYTGSGQSYPVSSMFNYPMEWSKTNLYDKTDLHNNYYAVNFYYDQSKRGSFNDLCNCNVAANREKALNSRIEAFSPAENETCEVEVTLQAILGMCSADQMYLPNSRTCACGINFQSIGSSCVLKPEATIGGSPVAVTSLAYGTTSSVRIPWPHDKLQSPTVKIYSSTSNCMAANQVKLHVTPVCEHASGTCSTYLSGTSRYSSLSSLLDSEFNIFLLPDLNAVSSRKYFSSSTECCYPSTDKIIAYDVGLQAQSYAACSYQVSASSAISCIGTTYMACPNLGLTTGCNVHSFPENGRSCNCPSGTDGYVCSPSYDYTNTNEVVHLDNLEFPIIAGQSLRFWVQTSSTNDRISISMNFRNLTALKPHNVTGTPVRKVHLFARFREDPPMPVYQAYQPFSNPNVFRTVVVGPPPSVSSVSEDGTSTELFSYSRTLLNDAELLILTLEKSEIAALQNRSLSGNRPIRVLVLLEGEYECENCAGFSSTEIRTFPTLDVTVSVKIEDPYGDAVALACASVLGFTMLVFVVYLGLKVRKHGSLEKALLTDIFAKTEVFKEVKVISDKEKKQQRKRSKAARKASLHQNNMHQPEHIVVGPPLPQQPYDVAGSAPEGFEPQHQEGVEGQEPQLPPAMLLRQYSMRQVEQEQEKKRGICSHVTAGIILFLVILIVCVLEVIKTLFNISLIQASLDSYLPTINLHELKDGIADALGNIRLSGLADAYEAFSELFNFLDFIKETGLSWNCGGSLSMISPVVMFIGAMLLIVFLQKDILMKYALTLQGSTINTTAFERKLKKAQSTILSIIIIYTLQSCMMVLARVALSVWTIRRSCSDIDATVVYYGRYLCMIFIAVAFYLAILIFAGLTSLSKYALTFGWIGGAVNLILLSMGIWTPSTIYRFEVISRAKKFDADEFDDDNGQESVIKLLGQSRGVIWVALPYGILLAKACELLNHPPFLIWNGRRVYDFKLRTPVGRRFLLWFIHLLKLICMIGTVVIASIFQYLYIATVVLDCAFTILELTLPEPKPLDEEQLPEELRKKLEAARKEALQSGDFEMAQFHQKQLEIQQQQQPQEQPQQQQQLQQQLQEQIST